MTAAHFLPLDLNFSPAFLPPSSSSTNPPQVSPLGQVLWQVLAMRGDTGHTPSCMGWRCGWRVANSCTWVISISCSRRRGARLGSENRFPGGGDVCGQRGPPGLSRKEEGLDPSVGWWEEAWLGGWRVDSMACEHRPGGRNSPAGGQGVDGHQGGAEKGQCPPGLTPHFFHAPFLLGLSHSWQPGSHPGPLSLQNNPHMHSVTKEQGTTSGICLRPSSSLRSLVLYLSPGCPHLA